MGRNPISVCALMDSERLEQTNVKVIFLLCYYYDDDYYWLLILLLIQVLVSLSLFLFPKSRYIEFDRGCLMNEIQFICFIRTVTNPEIWLDLSAVQIFLTLPKGTLSNAFASRKHYKPVCNPIILSHKVSQKVRIVRCLFTIRYVNVTFIHLIPEFSKIICSL